MLDWLTSQKQLLIHETSHFSGYKMDKREVSARKSKAKENINIVAILSLLRETTNIEFVHFNLLWPCVLFQWS